MRVKDAFDVLVQENPPVGVTLERLKSTELHVNFPLSKNYTGGTTPLSIIIGVVVIFGGLFLYSYGMSIVALILCFLGVAFVLKNGNNYLVERRFTHFSLELTSKGVQLYKVDNEQGRQLKAEYNWGDLLAVSVEQVPKSKERPAPYYIHLQTKNNAVRLFNGQLPAEEIAYAASMLEALLDQRYRGAVPINWRKTLEALGDPLLIDWSEHLIDDE